MLSKVFGRPLRTMSLCFIAIYYVFYSTVYNLSLSVFLPCWRINVFIKGMPFLWITVYKKNNGATVL